MKIIDKNKISLLTVDCDRSYITYHMLLSLFKLGYRFPIYIIINKDNKWLNLLYDLQKQYNNINLIDNTNNKIIKINQDVKNYASVQHSLCLQYGIDNLIKTDYVLICDNDIIFKKSFSKLIDIIKKYDIIAELSTLNHYDLTNIVSLISYYKENTNWSSDKFNILYEYYKENLEDKDVLKYNIKYNRYLLKYNKEEFTYYTRFLPYFLIFNLKNKIKIIDKNDIANYINIDKNITKDTLSIFTYNCLKNNLKYNEILINNYIEHINHASYSNSVNSIYNKYLS